MAVARALLREAPLLLADEATSAVDALTEAELIESLRRGTARSEPGDGGSAPPRTLVAVVHRLASVTPAASWVVVFRAGRVVEQGKHDELLALDGEYRRLWLAQQKQPQA